MSFIVTLIVVMLVSDALWWWLADRAVWSLRRSRLWRALLGTFMAAQVGCLGWMLLGRVSGDRPEQWLPRWLVANVYIWHFVGLPLAAGTMGLWGLWRGAGLAERWCGRLATGAEKTPDPLEKGSGVLCLDPQFGRFRA